jgi:nucleoside-diphosphate-sugar epimerase
MPTLLITGASGFLGGSIASYFEARNWNIIELGRRASSSRRQWKQWALDKPITVEDLRALHGDALIHCAWDFSLVRWHDIATVNVAGSQALIAAASHTGIPRIIAVSTISAFPECRSLYGKAKLMMEATAKSVGAFIVRPGLTWGSTHPGGMFNSLERQALLAKVIPLVDDGHYPQYLLHHEDLAAVLFNIVSSNVSVHDPLTLAHPKPWPLRELVLSLAKCKGRTPHFVKVPWRLLWSVAKVGEALRLPLPFRSDSLVSLVHQNPSPDFASAERLGLRLRAFAPF